MVQPMSLRGHFLVSIALAGLLSERDAVSGKRVAVAMTGGNCDFPLLQQALAHHP